MEAASSPNPFRIIARIVVVLIAVDALQLVTGRTVSFVAYTRIALYVAFLIFYALKHRFAWYVAVASGPLIAAVYLFLYFTGGQIYRPPAHAREIMVMWAVGEVIVLAVVLTYLARLREPYFRYVACLRHESI